MYYFSGGVNITPKINAQSANDITNKMTIVKYTNVRIKGLNFKLSQKEMFVLPMSM